MRITNIVKIITSVLAGGLVLTTTGCSMLFGPNYRDSNGVVTASASVNASALKVGDCLYNISETGDTVGKVQVVPCTSSHEAEVYATTASISNITMTLQSFCKEQFKLYIGIDYNDSDLDVTYIRNDSSSLKTDLQCIVYSEGNMVTTSYKDSQM